jgi:hypothetical protein
MSEIINLADNIISKEDREQLASFGGHTIAHGRATRWHWGKAANGDAVFEIFRGGANEVLAVCISRDRKMDAFYAHDATGNMISTGKLDHVMAELEQYFIQLHGESPDTSA